MPIIKPTSTGNHMTWDTAIPLIQTEIDKIPTVQQDQKNVIFYAHRGLSIVAPENTIPSFLEAARAGAKGIEIDIQYTSDGVWVCMHDDNIDRTTDGTGFVRDLTLAQIKNATVDVGNNLAYYPPIKVPTLDDFLSICKKFNIVPMFEIKGTTGKDVAGLTKIVQSVQRWGVENTAIIESMDYVALQLLRTINSRIALTFVGLLGSITIESCRLLGNSCITTSETAVTEALMKEAKEKRVPVIVWTVDDYKRCKELLDMGVDGVISNVILGGA